MTQVVLIRPGATVYDEQDRIQGVLDIPLSERGRAEVALLTERRNLAIFIFASIDDLRFGTILCTRV